MNNNNKLEGNAERAKHKTGQELLKKHKKDTGKHRRTHTWKTQTSGVQQGY